MTIDWAALTSTTGALAHPATRICVGIAAAAVVGMLAAGPVWARIARPEVARDIKIRTLTWAVLAPITFAAVLTAPLTLILFTAALGLLCHREFARVTGLHREHLTSAVVVVGVLLSAGLTLSGADEGVRNLAQAGVLAGLCVLNILPDRPEGYIRRCALGAGSFMLFGVGLQRLAELREIRGLPDARALACVLLVTVQMNDVFAYCTGRALSARLGGAKWFRTTSPGKTVAGHLGAIALTTPLAAWLLSLALRGSALDRGPHLAALALIIAVGGQLGDLLISSVKRDVGVKDMGALLPGHGGVLDRCNSLLLVIPLVYHYARRVLEA